MIVKIFNFIISILVWLVSFLINICLQVLPSGITPDLTNVTNAINTFWDYAFSYMSWICNALCLSPLHIRLIIDILTIRYLAKPLITVVKIVINWFWGAKDN